MTVATERKVYIHGRNREERDEMSVAMEKKVFRHGKNRNFTEEELDDYMEKMMAVYGQNDNIEFCRLGMELPLDADMALIFRDVFGCRFIRDSGLDCTEAERKFGKNWLENGPEEGVLPYDDTE